MTALNQQMFDKVNEIFIIVAQKISEFSNEPDFDGPNLLPALLKLQNDAKTYQDLLSDDTIKILPDKIEEIQNKLDALKDVTVLTLIDCINQWATFLTALSTIETPENNDENA